MTLNPLNWTGPHFLALYGALLIFLALGVFKYRKQGAGLGWPRRDESADPIELAFLSGGKARAADAALIGLLTAGAGSLTEDNRELVFRPFSGPLPSELEAFRDAGLGVMSRLGFHAAVARILDEVRCRLLRRRLIPSESDVEAYRHKVVGLFSPLVILGLAKMAVGIARGRPVNDLETLLIFTVVLAVLFYSRPPLRTWTGMATIRAAKSRHARAIRAPLPAELPLAFALIGVASLSGTPFSTALAGSIGGGPSTSGGCGGGGSGCGGGGCGGCGG